MIFSILITIDTIDSKPIEPHKIRLYDNPYNKESNYLLLFIYMCVGFISTVSI